MLILSRYKDQKIMINDDIIIKIHDVNLKTGEVKLGFIAPQIYAIEREEVYKRKALGLPPKRRDDD